MFKKIYILYISIIMLTIRINACDWLASYNENDDVKETICGIAEADPYDPYGGFLLVGFTDVIPDGKDHTSLLVRIDRYGNILWKKYNTLPNGTKTAHYTSDDNHGFLIGGNGGLTKIDGDGNIVSGWETPILLPEAALSKANITFIEKYESDIYPGVDMYIVIYAFWRGIVLFDEDNKEVKHAYADNLSVRALYEGRITTDGNIIFSGEEYQGGNLWLYKTDQTLTPVSSFGTNGFKEYSDYSFGSSIQVCSNGSGYVIACADASDNIELIKTRPNGDIVSLGEWDYTQKMIIAKPEQGMWKSLGLKELSEGNFILGGIFSNIFDADFFIQIVDAEGEEDYLKKFENYGYDGNY